MLTFGVLCSTEVENIERTLLANETGPTSNCLRTADVIPRLQILLLFNNFCNPHLLFIDYCLQLHRVVAILVNELHKIRAFEDVEVYGWTHHTFPGVNQVVQEVYRKQKVKIGKKRRV